MRIQRFKVPLKINYKDLLKLAPKDYSEVSAFNKILKQYEKRTVNRRYMSYGVSPKFRQTGKSYMFNNQQSNIPEELVDLLTFARTIDNTFNNIYINWYKDGNDYIDPHSDCVSGLEPGSFILIVNFNEGEYCRTFKIQYKEFPENYKEILLENGLAILLGSEEQTKYRHWVDKENTKEGRISVTFRTVKENQSGL